LRVDGSAYPFISLVGSDVAYGGGLKFFGSTTQYAEMYGEYESSNNGQIFFRTRKAGAIETALTIKSSGNTGINTTTPLRKLHVVDTSAQIRVSYNSATDERYAELSWFGITGYAGDTNNQFNIGFDGGNSANGGINFNTGASGAASTRMRISRGGNVGIATTSPVIILHVQGSSVSALFAGNTTTINEYSGIVVSPYPAQDANGNYGVELRATITQSSPNYLNPRMDFVVQNTNTYQYFDRGVKMTILGSGYVGINTTSPSAFLHISESSYGTGLLITTSSINGADITLTNTGAGGKRWDITSGGSNNGIGAGGLQFYNNTDGVMRMGISSAGNVLINSTTDAGYKFQVAGSGHRFSISPHGGGIDMASTGNLAPHYTTSVDFYLGAIGSGSLRLSLSSGGSLTAVGSMTATSFFESSDKNIKTLIEDNYQTKGIESVVAKLYTKNGKEELGYFAQDVQDILPSAVSKGLGGLLSLSYREVHTAKIARLEKELEELKAKLN
jgi:hypothetical protein